MDGITTDAPTVRSARPVLLFGGSGQVGRQLLVTLAPIGRVVAPGRADADLADAQSLREIITRVRPRVVVLTPGTHAETAYDFLAAGSGLRGHSTVVRTTAVQDDVETADKEGANA